MLEDWATRRKPLYGGSSETLRRRIWLPLPMELSPEWVVGFTDGEGCFHIAILPNPKTALGYEVLPEFVVVQHRRSIAVLYALKRFFGHGFVRPNQGDRYAFRIRSLEGLEKVCDFFTKHPLKTQKRVDFTRFRRVVHKMKEGRHLSVEGLLEIIDIAMRMNSRRRQALEKIRAELIGKGIGPKPSPR